MAKKPTSKDSTRLLVIAVVVVVALFVLYDKKGKRRKLKF